MFPTVVKVRYWYSVSNETLTETYFIYAKDLRQAVEQIDDWLGQENIYEVSFEFFEECVVKVDEDFVQKLREEHGFD